MKKVSIVIPLYNAQNFIEKTINSCLQQSYQNIDINVIDDCSSDDSVDIIKNKFIPHHKNVKLICNSANRGLMYTVNRGINISDGEYIIALGNDDFLDLNHVEYMVNLLDSSKKSFAYCGSRYVDENDVVFGESNTLDVNNNMVAMAKGNIVNSCGLIMRRNDLIAVGGYPEYLGYRNYGEWYLWLLLIKEKGAIYTNEVKSNYRKHKNNLTKTFFNVANLRATRDYNLKCMDLALSSFKYSPLEKLSILGSKEKFKMQMFYRINARKG